MDFIMGLPRIFRGLDSIWVIVDQLTKLDHFLHVHTFYSDESFWRTFQEKLGIRVDLSTIFHLLTDGQLKHTSLVLKDMLWACVMDFGGQWDQLFPLAEFACNNSYHSSFQMALVFLCVSPMKGVIRFGRQGKHNPSFYIASYVPDESHLLQYDVVDLDDRLRYIEEPLYILAKYVKQLRSRVIPVVKVFWRHCPVKVATWETDQEMRA
ncbi:uncharacterized protein LOC129872438 [Solanum dulcamara]|uniref:uncharacterized protein LOC129872438 n=1 Tax=Solanum dulcamara TaxID=45834 RepID=UPI0024853A7C|nr:uncharacterized protein LOC129872438 [Solanum dulcamara]